MNAANVYFQLKKFDEFQGLATGILTDSTVDKDRERLDYVRSKPYFQAWSDTQKAASQGKSLGNVRLQHDPKRPVGLLTALDFDDANQRITCTAKLVDPIALAMLKAGILTGFSIGGSYVSKTPQKDGSVLYVADPSEISVVDRPCQPHATFESVKTDGSIELRKFRQPDDNATLIRSMQELLDKGHAVWEICSAFNLPLSVRKTLHNKAEKSLRPAQVLTGRRLAIRRSRGWMR